MELQIIQKAKQLIEAFHCCNSCLGRQFGNLLSGLSNMERGKALKIALLMEWENNYRLVTKELPNTSLLAKDFPVGSTSAQRYYPEISFDNSICGICKDRLSQDALEIHVRDVIPRLTEYEFRTLLVGCRFPSDILDDEDNIRSTFGIEFGESIKSEFNREIGKRLLSELPQTEVDFKAPDLVILFDLVNNEVKLKSNPLFILGRYRKLVRGIPQSKWFCRECRGQGCERCGFTGKMYQESVEEFISAPVLAAAQGVDSKFHGAGREDIDARMLGNGRPFALEISEPKKRTLDLAQLKTIIDQNAQGKIEVEFDGLTTRTKVRELKTQSSRIAKGYRAIVELEPERNVTEKSLYNAAKDLSNSVIHQRTPVRVSHRRADKIRTRKVISFEIESITSEYVTIHIVCEGGLYVKELINGDEERTQPNFAGLVGTKATVKYLDVIKVFSPESSL
ncbi:MAG: tRNA pseudouridine(54/55) synthase Pus10 [Candidatus Heimdallarchaeota archaeon]